MREDEKILVFTNRIRQLASTLKSMGADIDDKTIAMAVFNGLPERFNSVISALDALGSEEETFSLDLAKSRLLEEERIEVRTRGSSTKSETSALFYTSFRNWTAYHNCRNCGKAGHQSQRCWEKLPKLAFYS